MPGSQNYGMFEHERTEVITLKFSEDFHRLKTTIINTGKKETELCHSAIDLFMLKYIVINDIDFYINKLEILLKKTACY